MRDWLAYLGVPRAVVYYDGRSLRRIHLCRLPTCRELLQHETTLHAFRSEGEDPFVHRSCGVSVVSASAPYI